MIKVDGLRNFRMQPGPMIAQQAIEPCERNRVFGLTRLIERLTPAHLFHQEGRRHRGIGFSLNRRAVQLAEIGRPACRIGKRAVRFVGLRGQLHRNPMFGTAGPRKAIGMHRCLQPQIGLLQALKIELIRLRQAQKLEMTFAAEIHAATFRS